MTTCLKLHTADIIKIVPWCNQHEYSYPCSVGEFIIEDEYLHAKTRHNDTFLEIQIFASVSLIFLKLCSVAIPMLYRKYFLSYKAR